MSCIGETTTFTLQSFPALTGRAVGAGGTDGEGDEDVVMLDVILTVTLLLAVLPGDALGS